MSKKRRVFSAEFKAAVALEAIKEQEIPIGSEQLSDPVRAARG